MRARLSVRRKSAQFEPVRTSELLSRQNLLAGVYHGLLLSQRGDHNVNLVGERQGELRCEKRAHHHAARQCRKFTTERLESFPLIAG